MDLYFLDHNGKETLVRKGVKKENFSIASLDDLKTRRPNLISHYQRIWETDEGRYMLDYGSYTEFYILKPESKL